MSICVLQVVKNYLGLSSATSTFEVNRDALAIPSITIQAPPFVSILSTTTTTLSALATLASCFTSASGVQSITFLWTNNRTALLASAAASTARPLIRIDPLVASQRDLRLQGSWLASGVIYIFRVTGCMLADPTVCGQAELSVALRDQPLEGGVRLIFLPNLLFLCLLFRPVRLAI